MLGLDFHLVPTMIGFGMSAGFFVFVCTRIICGKARTFHPEHDSRIDDLEQQPQTPGGGLEPVLVSAIPTMRFSRKDFKSIEDVQCAICLEDYEEKDMIRLMPKCGHKFHQCCVDVWFIKHSTCPICRSSLARHASPLPSS